MSNETTEEAYDYREDPEYWRAPFDFTKPYLMQILRRGGCVLS